METQFKLKNFKFNFFTLNNTELNTVISGKLAWSKLCEKHKIDESNIH